MRQPQQTKMTSRERVIAVLKHHSTDRVAECPFIPRPQ